MLRDLLGNRTTDELLEDTAILFQKVKNGNISFSLRLVHGQSELFHHSPSDGY